LTVGVSLLLAGAAVAAGPDPSTSAKPGQGTLAIVTLDNEITVAFQGTGYNIHRFSSLHLAVTPGQNDFDYFCGNTKYFVGNVHVAAGQTTTVTLQPGLCEQPVVSQPKAGPTPTQLAQAQTDGFTDGLGCAKHNDSYSTDPALQAAYDSGYDSGSIIAKC
jgi:hypothetical protein